MDLILLIMQQAVNVRNCQILCFRKLIVRGKNVSCNIIGWVGSKYFILLMMKKVIIFGGFDSKTAFGVESPLTVIKMMVP